MRVLHITSGNLFGGVETILTTLARSRHLCPEMEPHFAICFDGKLSQTLQEAGAAVHLLGGVRFSRPWTVVRARKNLQALLRSTRFDAAICHMAWPQAIFGSVVRRHGVPLLFYAHNRISGSHWTERLARRTPPDRVISVSQDTAATIANLYQQVPNVVLYSPLPGSLRETDKDQRQRTRQSLGVTGDTPVIIQVSRMEPWKGHPALLSALAALKDLQWTCWIVGGAQKPDEIIYLQRLTAQARQSGIEDRIRFLGERSDVPSLLAAADLFCQPNTQSEGFSIVFMEAFLASLPIVTTAIGGGLEMVTGSCGALLPMNDGAALEQALRRLLSDPGERGKLGAAGRQRVLEMCDPAAQLGKLHSICAGTAAGR